MTIPVTNDYTQMTPDQLRAAAEVLQDLLHEQGVYGNSQICLKLMAVRESFKKVVAADSNAVSPDNACPKCGEARSDYLAWHDDMVICATCDNMYSPGASKRLVMASVNGTVQLDPTWHTWEDALYDDVMATQDDASSRGQ